MVLLITLENYRKYATLVGHGKVIDRLLWGGPVIMLTGHFGNWEMAGYLFGVFGFPPYSVARTLDNPYLDRFLRSFRERTGQKMIAKKGGYDQMLEVLRTGGVLSFLADQDAGERGMFVDFFGRPASTHKAIALLAIEHQAPVMVGYARRIGPGFRYEVGCTELIDPSEFAGTADDARLLTQRYTSALETIIRRDPEQYLWLHRRWKHQPKERRRPPSRPPARSPARHFDLKVRLAPSSPIWTRIVRTVGLDRDPDELAARRGRRWRSGRGRCSPRRRSRRSCGADKPPGSRGSPASSSTVCGRAPLARAVVHDGHRRGDRPDQGRVIRDVHPVMGHLIEVDRPDLVHAGRPAASRRSRSGRRSRGSRTCRVGTGSSGSGRCRIGSGGRSAGASAQSGLTGPDGPSITLPPEARTTRLDAPSSGSSSPALSACRFPSEAFR